jgi:predicted DNA-binding transcriptional regulator AlpA
METTELRTITQLLERVEAVLAHATNEHQLFVLTLLYGKAITAQGDGLAKELRALREPLVTALRDRQTAPPTTAQPATTQAAYCTEREVAQFLHVSLALLRRWRMQGKGPKWVKVGRLVRYPRRDLEAFQP